ncbi:hypothetical protein ACFORH_05720 [Amycolatopsis roodepoortensis]|uniref:Uncharacterized protein n=1 Tax=Amycolatopsis roodepoortensis TaxID=700274 RepID=A0ABR9L821_9PSEU|nr:hypothetical protein [Amycolatopsis roodepoortensis]MBE1576507.1 hypothetical protein [Amycolatopsis roodepoortensis]
MFSTTGENPWQVRVTRLRYQVLSGTPYAHVSPVEWQVDPDSIRMIARERGYLEIPPMFPGCLSFRHAPDRFPPAPAFDHPETGQSKHRERRLRNRIDGAAAVWLSVRHAGLSTRHITEIAADEGMTVVADLSDPTDRLLLLSRDPRPPTRPVPVQAGLKRFRYSFLIWLLPLANFFLCFLGGFIVSASNGYDPETPLVTVLILMAFGLAIPLSFIVAVFPRTTRAGWLAKEFNGSNSVQFPLSTFGISEALAVQLAAHHGYFLIGHTGSRMHGRYLKFAKQV